MLAVWRRQKERDDFGEIDWLILINKRTGVESAEAFADAFRIDIKAAEGLCYSNDIETPKQAARAIRKLIANLEAAGSNASKTK